MKNRLNKLLPAALILFCMMISASTINAQEFSAATNGDEIAEQIKNAGLETHSIQSDFEQLKHLSFLEEDVRSTGIFYFKQKQRVRWEYLTPYSYIIVIEGDIISIKNEDKINHYDASSNPMFTEINNIMMGIATGELLSGDRFGVEYFKNDSAYLLKLSPKNEGMRSFITEIHLFINILDLTVDAIKFLEQSDDYTMINFKNKVRNAVIEDDIFHID